MNADNVTMQP